MRSAGGTGTPGREKPGLRRADGTTGEGYLNTRGDIKRNPDA
jgi:hypothetical protein